MVNLRPRVQDFNPRRRIEVVGGGGGDTFERATVDRSGVNETLDLLASVRGLSKSVDGFLGKQQEAFLRGLETEADAAVEGLSPEDIREQSAAEWEAHSKATGIDNAWWKIKLDEAAGKRMATEFSTALAARSLEATDPNDPQAHFRILQEEQARATDGLGHFAKLQFKKNSERLISAQARTWAEGREARVQANLEDAYQTTVRGQIKNALDPENGGVVDLTVLMDVIQEEHARSGNPGRKEVINAIRDSVTLSVAEAESPEELDAILTRGSALLSDVGDQEFGPDGKTLEELSSLEMADLQLGMENQIETRERVLNERAERDELQQEDQIRDTAVGLAGKMATEELPMDEAVSALRKSAVEQAGGNKALEDALFGTGLVTLSTTNQTLQSGEFASRSDVRVFDALRSEILARDFDSGAFVETLDEAKERWLLSYQDYRTLVTESGDKRGRDIRAAATNFVTPKINATAVGLQNVTAASLLVEIADPAERDQVQGWLNTEIETFRSEEAEVLIGLIEKHGVGNELTAQQEYSAGYNARELEWRRTTTNRARLEFDGKVTLDAQAAFRDGVQSDAAYPPAREFFINEYVKEQYKDRKDDAELILSSLDPTGFSETETPIEDLAALVASGRGNSRSGEVLKLFNDGEGAFQTSLGEDAKLGEEGVDVLQATRAGVEALRARSTSPASFDPEAEPPRDLTATDLQEDRAKVANAAGGNAAASSMQSENLNAARVAEQRYQDDPGFSDEIRAEAKRRTEEASKKFAETSRRAWLDQERILDVAAQRGDFTVIGVQVDYDAPYGKKGDKSATREEYLERTRDFRFKQVIGRNPFLDTIRFQGGRIVLENPPRYSPGRNQRQGRINLDEAEARTLEVENAWTSAKLWTGLTLDEVKAGKGIPYPGAPEEDWLLIDRDLIKPASTPFFRSIAELDALTDAEIKQWLTLFPSVSKKNFIAYQRLVILERVPEGTTAPPKPKATPDKPIFPGGDFREVENEDGSVSNVKTATVEFDGTHFVIPTMIAGKQLSFDEAIAEARKQGLDKHPSFPTSKEALDFSKSVHGDIDERGFLRSERK